MTNRVLHSKTYTPAYGEAAHASSLGDHLDEIRGFWMGLIRTCNMNPPKRERETQFAQELRENRTLPAWLGTLA